MMKLIRCSTCVDTQFEFGKHFIGYSSITRSIIHKKVRIGKHLIGYF